MDCNASPDFYSLNARIGTDQHFQTDDAFFSVAARGTGGSTVVSIDGSTDRVSRVGSVPDGQLGSPSQARVKAILPESGKQRGKFETSNIRVGNTLLLNTLFVEVPSFVAKETEPTERPETETERPQRVNPPKSPAFSNNRNAILSRRRGGEKKESQKYGSRLREEGYLPGSQQRGRNELEARDKTPSVEGSGEGSEREDNQPTGVSNAVSSSDRGSYLPDDRSEDSSAPSSRGSYLPDEGTELPDESNYLSEEPPQSTDDLSFLLPPSSSPSLPNSLLDAFALPDVDEYSPEAPTTAAPRLPPMNLLPLSNESPPSTEESRLPSTTESYGILDENEVGPVTERGFGRGSRRRGQNGNRRVNAVQRGRQTTEAPAEEPSTTAAPPKFQYNLDSVLSVLRERLRDVEPFDVPAETLATSGGATAAPSGGSTGSGVAPSPWLFSLAKLPM